MSEYTMEVAYFGLQFSEIIQFLRKNKFINLTIYNNLTPPDDADFDFAIVVGNGDLTTELEEKQLDALVRQYPDTPFLPIDTKCDDARNTCDTKIHELFLEQFIDSVDECQKRLPWHYKGEELLYLDQLIKILKSAMSDKDKSYLEKVHIITEFQEHFQNVVGINPSAFGKAFFIATTMIAVTLLAGFLGYSVGFLAGAWTGPGAFFTALMLGNAAAAAVAGIGGGCGLFGGAWATYGLFSHQKAVQPLVDITEEAFGYAELFSIQNTL